MPAFSTCWNNSRHTDGEAMIDEILELGFSELELSHGMTITKLPGIKKAFEDGRFTCLGVHNYFPSPVEVMIDAPDAYEYTSHRGFDRQRAMEMTKRTLDLAAQFKAKYVVLHMGSVPLSPKKWTKRLTTMVAEGERDTARFAKERIAFVKKREKLGPLYYQRAIAALEQIAEQAKELDLLLAIESRSRFEDMPTEREMIALQEHFKDHPNVGYWHDFGHVQLKHNLGLLDHHEWLETMRPYLIGGHVHDVQWPARDHRVPFTGELDYQQILSFFPAGCPLTWELSPTRKSEEILEAFAAWKHLFPDR
ncbi:sugar phosphate isomerase/epimerase family protein [Haloferula sargassicola]|uniref:Xylose isomerase-like TIM barrel domain-containing protein n=1 Tax=Haloferula sargassicola TaxID=490096 RepID=A0ABP9UPP2_9BACT